MRSDLTIIYYTSNRENPRFEARIRRTLRHMSRPLPIISVSQKPIDFGKNICVGDVGASSHNAWRQLQIGAMEATTEFVCTAESDTIYPRQYFQFRPKRNNVAYLVKPLWVLFSQRGKATIFVYKPRSSESSMVVGRECLIDAIDRVFDGYDKWGMGSANGETFPYLLTKIRKSEFNVSIPVITFKTDENMHRGTPHQSSSKCRELPFIGSANALRKRYTK